LFDSYRFSDPKRIVFGLDCDREAKEQTIACLLSRPFKPKTIGELCRHGFGFQEKLFMINV
tara:strand:- start:413 stop:595 length:183 start_codon:yes stop_codon:yes gene_type:complete